LSVEHKKFWGGGRAVGILPIIHRGRRQRRGSAGNGTSSEILKTNPVQYREEKGKRASIGNGSSHFSTLIGELLEYLVREFPAK